MSKIGEINKQNRDLGFPRIRVLHYSYLEMRSSWNNPCRNAPFWRFYWNQTPGAKIIFQGEEIELKKEEIVLIPPHTNYGSFADGSFFQLYMHFEWENPVPVTRPLTFSSAPFLKHLLEIPNWFGKSEEQFEIRMYALLLYYLMELQTRSPAQESMKHDCRIDEALEIINKDLSLSSSEVAAKVNMSRDNFQRTFLRCIGIPPCRYRISRRMELAQELLLHSTLTMDEIALKTGFVNRYQFSKSYRQFFKVSPGRVRKKR